MNGCLDEGRFRFNQWRYALLGVLACGVVMGIHWLPLIAVEANPPAPLQQAQVLNREGQQAFAAGQPEAALEYWEQAEVQYRQANDDLGIWGSQLNQAKALQTIGFYRRAHDRLRQLVTPLETEPPSPLKVNVWLTYGHGLRLLGDLSMSQSYLEQGLTMAQQLKDGPHQQAAYLSLGNTLVAQQQWAAAADQYQQATVLAGPLQFTARLRQLQTLPYRQQEAAILPQAQALIQDLAQDASAHTQIYATLDLIQWLMQYVPEAASDLSPAPDALLQTALQQAQILGDRRAESYAWGCLGQWYEQQQQWSDAEQDTQKALDLAQALNADELVYQWQWQQGRIARSQGEKKVAIIRYTQAVDTLQNLRQEIVAITRDVQFSFRDEIEPIYRDLVQLLLNPDSLAMPSQRALEQARQVLESLQLSELNNFFREPCLESIPQSLDTLDPTAAIIYPIILPDQLAVILSIPGQPLYYYTTSLPQATIEAGIQQMLDSMRLTSFTQERLTAAQQLYQWLIKPAEQTLQSEGIETLTFVMDGALRNLPIAALHTGTHYLVEDYRLALSPGLQLMQVTDSSKVFIESEALVGGLSVGRPNRPPLVGVQQEIAHIEQLINTQVLLDEAFTTRSLVEQAQQRLFDVVHLATHAQFGETDAETFIETWDGMLQISQLRQLLRQQDTQGLPPALLVLSACDTAQGNDKAVLGMAGLAVRSGAQATLATLWSVNDRATAIFIEKFYDALIHQGLTKATAVQYAQQQLIQTPAFQHPYYWSPFVLVGDWL